MALKPCLCRALRLSSWYVVLVVYCHTLRHVVNLINANQSLSKLEHVIS